MVINGVVTATIVIIAFRVNVVAVVGAACNILPLLGSMHTDKPLLSRA